ncbi:SDR family NAD(P)-dependent oxidoreductase [Actinoplanes sp. NPDC051411]|uniref:SDR family NAD(P)-dependent oxidoreductase n=1 Tax=Actinoplanes sp. NPDC051411 TaxID=3155522 RepID=UPI003424B52D
MPRVLLITGGAGGIGAAMAHRFAATGGRVLVADIDEETGRAVASAVGGLFVRTDVSNEDDNRRAVEAAISEFGGLDLVHLNAGTGGAGGAGDDFDLSRYRRTLAVNLDGTMFGLRAALPALAAHGGGAVVVTASLAGLGPATFDPVYSATKHAIVGLVRSLAPAWSDAGITINAICPGFVDTQMITGLQPLITAGGLAVATPDEVAAAVESLASSGVTGEAWTIQAGTPPTRFPFPAIDLPKAR